MDSADGSWKHNQVCTVTELHNLECSCRDHRHVFRAWLFQGTEIDPDPDLLLFIQLNPNRNVLQRIWAAIRYILGYGSKFGHWDEVLIDPKSARILGQLCQAVVDHTEKHNPTPPLS